MNYSELTESLLICKWINCGKKKEKIEKLLRNCSPVATEGFWGLISPKQSSKPLTLKHETL